MTAVAAAIIVIGGGAFWGGMQYQASKTPARGAGAFAGQFGDAATQAAGRNFRAGAGGGAVFGTILSADSSSITVRLGAPGASSTAQAETGTKLVLVNASTEVAKTTSGSHADLTVGASVVVNGTANSDGSVTAQTIQIRPASGIQR